MTLLVKNEIHLNHASAYVCTDANIADGIQNFIHQQGADLLAMVPQKRAFPAMLWHKSVTKQVSYHPEIPLLIIHSEF